MVGNTVVTEVDWWRDLEKRFQELAQSGQFLNLTHTWGTRVADDWYVAGIGDSMTTRHFKALASLAGQRILERHMIPFPPHVRADQIAEWTWYRVVWLLMGSSNPPITGFGIEDPGERVHSGRINNVVAASVITAAKIQGIVGLQAESKSVSRWLERHHVLIGLALAALAVVLTAIAFFV